MSDGAPESTERASPEAPPERVLTTLNQDGSRRWIRPRPVVGRYRRWRRRLAVVLMILFVGVPWVEIGGEPLFLFDVVRRQFTFFGQTFLPKDTLLLALFLLGSFLSWFLLTATMGRAWCGWGCPQNVYLDFMFRPLDRGMEQLSKRLFGRKLTDPLPVVLQILRVSIYAVLCLVLANSFLAWFVGWDALLAWMGSSPAEQPAAFGVVAVVTGAMMFDFLYFREQMCHLACPYGRIQSALLDPDTMIVAYDAARGEPRGKPRVGARQGDCLDCGACHRSCPMGIDIRDGLQMECVTCASCVDACARVMQRAERPPGLVRYSSQAELEGKPWRLIRPRLFLYLAVICAVWGTLGFMLLSRSSADVVVLRAQNVPYTRLDSSLISSRARVKIENRSDEPRSYSIEIPELPAGQLVAPTEPISIPPGGLENTTIFVELPASAFTRGELPVGIRVHDGVDFDETVDFRLLGPWGER
jgi:cytochrome c oxidase accessory protein FixG